MMNDKSGTGLALRQSFIKKISLRLGKDKKALSPHDLELIEATVETLIDADVVDFVVDSFVDRAYKCVGNW